MESYLCVILSNAKNLKSVSICIFTMSKSHQILHYVQNDQTKQKITDDSSHQILIILPFCPKTLFGKLFAVFQCFKQVLVFRGIKIEKDKTHY